MPLGLPNTMTTGEWLGIVLVPMSSLGEDQVLGHGVTTLSVTNELICKDLCIIITLD